MLTRICYTKKMEPKLRRKKIIFLFVVFGILNFASGVLALETSWPRSPGGIDLTASSSLAVMVKYFYEWGIAIGGLAAFFALVMAGFQYLTSTGDPGKIKDAAGKIQSAIIGLVMLLASYLVLNLINPELTTLRMPSFEAATSTLGFITTTPPNLSRSCDKVIVYSQTNYATGTEKMTINKGDAPDVWISKNSGSVKLVYFEEGTHIIKEGGTCRVELYDRTGCGGSPMTTIYFSSPNIGALYLKSDVQCVAVKEL